MKKNSGFSLVELIVVIAIMAVLVGVLAPAYLKYVEKSRKSTDISAMADVMDSAKTIATDVEYADVKTTTTFTITSDANGKVTLSMANLDTTVAAKALDGWKSVSNGDGYSMKAKEYKKAGSIKAEVSKDGTVNWGRGNIQGVFADMCDYSQDFCKKFSTGLTIS